jgi:integrase
VGAKRHFGTVRRLPSGRYEAVYTHLGLRHRAPTTFATKSAALAFLAETEAEINRGRWADPTVGSMTVRQLSERWMMSNPAKTDSSRLRDQGILDRHLLPLIGGRPLHSIVPGDVQSLVNGWTSRALAPRTVRRHVATLKAMFNFAVRNDYLGRTPCRAINLPRVTVGQRHQLSVDDVERLASLIDYRYSLMVYLGAVLGLRWGEVAGLRLSSVDRVAHSVEIREQVVVTEGGGAAIGPPKSHAGRRTLSIPDALMRLIEDHVDHHGIAVDGLLFPTEFGHPLTYSNWHARVWKPAREAAGLPTVGFHDLRRANATALVAGGVDVKTAQSRLGHADARLTLEVYAQLTTDGDRRASEIAAERLLPDRLRSDCVRNDASNDTEG